jgi:hypothetical protein
MVIYFLQSFCTPPILPKFVSQENLSNSLVSLKRKKEEISFHLPKLQSERNKSSISQLFCEFFLFYGISTNSCFNIMDQMISIKDGNSNLSEEISGDDNIEDETAFDSEISSCFLNNLSGNISKYLTVSEDTVTSTSIWRMTILDPFEIYDLGCVIKSVESQQFVLNEIRRVVMIISRHITTLGKDGAYLFEEIVAPNKYVPKFSFEDLLSFQLENKLMLKNQINIPKTAPTTTNNLSFQQNMTLSSKLESNQNKNCSSLAPRIISANNNTPKKSTLEISNSKKLAGLLNPKAKKDGKGKGPYKNIITPIPRKSLKLLDISDSRKDNNITNSILDYDPKPSEEILTSVIPLPAVKSKAKVFKSKKNKSPNPKNIQFFNGFHFIITPFILFGLMGVILYVLTINYFFVDRSYYS